MKARRAEAWRYRVAACERGILKNMTTIQLELNRLDAQLSEAADLLRDGVDAQMAEADAALRALAHEISARARAALAAVDQDAELRLMATLPARDGR